MVLEVGTEALEILVKVLELLEQVYGHWEGFMVP